MNFKPVIQTWESEDGRFRINEAYPKGFCVIDTWSGYDPDNFQYSKHEFVNTFEQAVEWCKERAK